jgi:hypothetical protein
VFQAQGGGVDGAGALYLDHFEVAEGLCVLTTAHAMLLELNSRLRWCVPWSSVTGFGHGLAEPGPSRVSAARAGAPPSISNAGAHASPPFFVDIRTCERARGRGSGAGRRRVGRGDDRLIAYRVTYDQRLKARHGAEILARLSAAKQQAFLHAVVLRYRDD